MNDNSFMEETCDQAYLTDSIDNYDECNFDRHNLLSHDDNTDESYFMMMIGN